MFHYAKSPAPEPYASGALYLLYKVALYIRNSAKSIGPEQLMDLGDAIHNIPASLTEYGPYRDEQTIRQNFLAVYDAKWARKPNGMSLLATLDSGMEQAERWVNT